MNDSPLVSIVILTYNNFSVLRKSIYSILELEYENREIIVVDNASTDRTVEQINEEFGEIVTLLTRKINCPTAARNQGYWHARGEIILSIDHDMVFIDKRVIEKAVSYFRELPDIGVISARICGQSNPDSPLREHWWYPTPMKDGQNRHFFTNYFPEGAVFFRAEALKQSGGYDEDFHHFMENLDLALKLRKIGWKIVYCPSISSIELVVSKHVSHRRSEGNYYALRNRLWYVRKYYALPRAVAHALPRILLSAIRSVRYGWVDYFWSGLRDGLMAPKVIRDARAPLRATQWAEIRQVEGVPAPIALVHETDGRDGGMEPLHR